MANLNTVSYPEFTDLVMRKFQQEKDSLPIELRHSGIFKSASIPDGTGDRRRFAEVDGEEYAYNFGEGNTATEGLVEYGYEKDMILVRRGLTISITWKMRKHNKEQEVQSRLTRLGRTVDNRMELDLAHRLLTFMTSTSYTDMDSQTVDVSMGDGYALAYSAHTLTGSATTYRTILANNPAFSRGAMEAAERTGIENSYNLLGQKKAVTFDILVSTDDPVLCNAIKQEIQSTADISAPNEGVVNVYRAKFKHVKVSRAATTAAGAPDTTKRSYWGLIASNEFQAYLAVTDESHVTAPQAGSNHELLSGDWIYEGSGEYGIVIVSARGAIFSKGDASA